MAASLSDRPPPKVATLEPQNDSRGEGGPPELDEIPPRTRHAGLQRYGVVSLAVVIGVAALSVAQGFFIPVVVSIVIAMALARVVRHLQAWMPRWIAAALVVALLVGGLGTLAYSLSDEAARAIANLPGATKNLRQALRVTINRDQGMLGQLQRAIAELQRTATENTGRPATPTGVTPVQVVEPAVDVGNVVWLGSQEVLWTAAQLTLVLFLVYFLLAYGDLFKRKLVRLSGETLSQRKGAVQLIDQIGESVAKSFSHLLLASAVVGAATAISLRLMGVNYAGLWGLAAGLLNFVPYVGPLVVASGVFLVSVVQFGEIGIAALAAGITMTITALEGFLFTPLILGRSARVNPVAVFIGFLFWGWLWGIWGMLLAMPLLLIMRTIADHVEELAPLAEMLSD